MSDPTSPNHYKAGEVECIDAIRSALGPERFEGFLQGNCIKYVWRYTQKNGIEDLEKAKVYMGWLLSSAKEVSSD